MAGRIEGIRKLAGNKEKIAVIGGTGALGGGLAWRLARAGYPIVVGSRGAEKAQAAAEEIARETGGNVAGLENAAAAEAGEIVILTVPYASHEATLDQIAGAVSGKILVDTTVPLKPPKVARVQMPEAGSAAMETRAKVPDARVVSAFQNVAAHKLKDDPAPECDILITGDEVAAREKVVELAGEIGFRGVHCGPLDNAVVAEALTSILIGINKRYKVDGAGIRITGDLAASD